MSARRVNVFRANVFSAVAALASSMVILSGTIASASSLNPIRSGDKLQITVYNHSDLSQNVTVDDSDNISLPLIGIVSADGVDADGLAKRVAAKVARFDPRPAVDVQVLSSEAAIFISGGPVGVLPFSPGETLSQVIAEVASPPQQIANTFGSTPSINASRNLLNGRIDLHHVKLTRGKTFVGDFDAASFAETGVSGPSLKPGDIVSFIEKPVRVQVNGNVQEPGVAYLAADEPLYDAIAQVGGVTPDSASHVELSRAGHKASFPLGAQVLSQPGINGDVLVLPRAPHVGVVGAIDKPGDVMLRGDATLLSAIYNAGGPTRTANLKSVAVVHNGVRTQYNLINAIHGGTGNPILDDGDTVFVPVGHKIDFSAFWQAIGAAGTLALGLR